MPKKILFYYSIFNTGGAEHSTNKIINSLLERGYEIILLLKSSGGEFEQFVDKRVRIEYLKTGNFGNKYKTSNGLIKMLFFLLRVISVIECFLKGLAYRFRTFDAVIIGLHGLSPKFCLKNIKAKKYIQFIRNDLSLCDPNFKAQNNISKYGHLIDNYICVSQTALDSFNTLFPELSSKSIKIYNLLEAKNILLKSKDSIDDTEIPQIEGINILTVCRIQDKSKGVFRMLELCEELSNFGYNFKWYVIGDGPDFKELKSKIIDKRLEDKLMLLGKKFNPYPYFLKADLIAVLSYYEGLCGVVNEAKILKRPLIATEFSGIYEQITTNKNGIIVKNDYESILHAFKIIFDNKAILDNYQNNLMPEDINSDELKVSKLEMLFNG